MAALLGQFLSIDLTEDDLWNIYICLHNLTTTPKTKLYSGVTTKKEMLETKKKISRFGKANFAWPGIEKSL